MGSSVYISINIEIFQEAAPFLNVGLLWDKTEEEKRAIEIARFRSRRLLNYPCGQAEQDGRE